MKRVLAVTALLAAGCDTPPDCPGLSPGDMVYIEGTPLFGQYRYTDYVGKAGVKFFQGRTAFGYFNCEQLEKAR